MPPLRPRQVPALAPAGRGGWNFLGCHDELQGDGDVGAARADGAAAVGPPHKVTERVGEASVDPVPHHHSGAQGGVGEELLRLGDR